MTLQEIVQRLGQFGPGLTIYAQAPWQPQAKAIVARPRDDGDVPDEAVAAGCGYFLEVFIALGILQHFPIGPGQAAGELEQCARLIEYAEWVDSDDKPLSPAFMSAFTQRNYPYAMMIRCKECEGYFDLVVTRAGAQKYRCTNCGQELIFDSAAFMSKAIEQTRKMQRKRRGRR